MSELLREVHSRGIKQNFIANRANVEPAYLSRMLNYEVNPSLGIVSEVGEILGLELVWQKKKGLGSMKFFMWKLYNGKWSPRFEKEKKSIKKEETSWYSNQYQVPEDTTLEEAIKLHPSP
jgi:transcriptional regulator with XRE-family HTH domain